MNLNFSPAVERAAQAAKLRSNIQGREQTSLADWMAVLLEDDEGRPFELLIRSSLDAIRLRSELTNLNSPPAPADDELFHAARRHAIRLRGDPDVTTDLLLFAVLVFDPEFQTVLTDRGMDPILIERELVGAAMAVNSPLESMQTNETFEIPDIPKPQVESPRDLVETSKPAVESHAFTRILDVNLNRSLESLRILDDYARFVLNDRTITKVLKSLRHDLAQATDSLSHSARLAFRDTASDVGTSIAGNTEYTRNSTAHVAMVNFRRLQESLRSLEEYGKIESPPFAKQVEQIRYRTYSLEQLIRWPSQLRERLENARVYVLVTAEQCVHSLETTVELAVAGGATIFQMREKQGTDRELLARAKMFRDVTRRHRALFIMNDRPDLARLAEADGVHLGQDDLPPREARRILGPDKLIGISTHDLEQVRKAIYDGADYIGVGPVFPSQTKSFASLAGLRFVEEAFAATSLPAFALGGISPETIHQAVSHGATRVAVSSAVAKEDDPKHVVEEIMASLTRSR